MHLKCTRVQRQNSVPASSLVRVFHEWSIGGSTWRAQGHRVRRDSVSIHANTLSKLSKTVVAEDEFAMAGEGKVVPRLAKLA